ncbi:MAG: CBS domain-containing protein [Rhodocyclaceae bacterium]
MKTKAMLESLLVRDYMVGDTLAFTPDTPVLKAIHKLIQHELTGAPVIDTAGRVIGFLSEKDCMKASLSASYYEDQGGRVEDVMTRSVISLQTDDSLMKAVELFLAQPFRCYPVVNDSRLVGQLSRRCVLKAMEKLW